MRDWINLINEGLSPSVLKPLVPEIGDIVVANNNSMPVIVYYYLKKRGDETAIAYHWQYHNEPLIYCDREEAEFLGCSESITHPVKDVRILGRTKLDDGAYYKREAEKALDRQNQNRLNEDVNTTLDQELVQLQDYAKSIGVEAEFTDENSHSVGVVGLYRNKAPKGSGAQIMDRLCDIADRHDVEITLDAEGGSDGLFEYYGRWGFELEQHVIDDMAEEEDYAGPWIMYRLPKIKLSEALTKDNQEITFKYEHDHGKENRGFVLDKLTAYIEGEQVGYIKIDYIDPNKMAQIAPDDNFFFWLYEWGGKQFYPYPKISIKDFNLAQVNNALHWFYQPPVDEENIEKGRQFIFDVKKNKELKNRFRAFTDLWYNRPKVAYICTAQSDYNHNYTDQSGRGIGQQLYLEMARILDKQGMRLYGSVSQSDSAKAVWSSMEKKGWVSRDKYGRYLDPELIPPKE